MCCGVSRADDEGYAAVAAVAFGSAVIDVFFFWPFWVPFRVNCADAHATHGLLSTAAAAAAATAAAASAASAAAVGTLGAGRVLKVIDRILYKLDDLVRPYVHKILVVIEPLLIDEDYYARVEGQGFFFYAGEAM